MTRKLLRALPAALLWTMLLRENGAGYCLLLLLAAAVHEAGHLTAALVCRVPVSLPTFSGTGWKIRYDASASSYPAELWVILGGPAAGLLSGAAVWLLGLLDTNGGLFFALSSVGLSLWNLLPADGLDGGSLVRCIGGWVGREEAAASLLGITGKGVLIFLCAVGVWCQFFLGGNLSVLLVFGGLFATQVRQNARKL